MLQHGKPIFEAIDGERGKIIIAAASLVVPARKRRV